jgi:hypothetical protein
MPNRNLTPSELEKANDLLASIRERLVALAEGDLQLHFAYRRKIAKELTYDERKKPMQRRMLKLEKRALQRGLCAACGEELPEKYTVLDRLDAIAGYTNENTRLVCETCDRRVQKERGFK